MLKNLITYFILSLSGVWVTAQQTPVFSQYILNEFVLNPSVAGVNGMTSINLSGRKQWWGFNEYAPETYAVSFSSRLLRTKSNMGGKRLGRGRKGNVGYGSSIFSDVNGAINRTGIDLTYAYHLSIYDQQFSFGLKFQITQFRIDENIAKFRDENDPLTAVLGESTYVPDATFGFNYSTSNYHFGFAALNLFQSPLKFGDFDIDQDFYQQDRTYYILGTYKKVLPGNPKWEYEPSLFLRGTEKLFLIGDFSYRMIYMREYWFGLSVRTNGDVIPFMGLKYNKFYLGYSFDYGLRTNAPRGYGSHEITLAAKLGDDVRRYRWWQRY